MLVVVRKTKLPVYIPLTRTYFCSLSHFFSLPLSLPLSLVYSCYRNDLFGWPVGGGEDVKRARRTLEPPPRHTGNFYCLLTLHILHWLSNPYQTYPADWRDKVIF